MVTGVWGAGQVFPAGSPFETQTMTFPMVLPLPRTSISFAAGVGCFLAHTGSASMVSGLSVGAFPSKVTVPVIDEAAKATPGHTTIATSPAARHTLFPVTRMLGSLVDANLVSVVTVDAAFRILAQAPIRSVLRRSRTPGIRQAAGRAGERAPAVA